MPSKRSFRFTTFAAVATIATTALVLSATACKKPAPPAAPAPAPAPPVTTAPAPAPVAAVALGTAVSADNKISAPATAFKPTDTIFLSVTTQGEQGGRSLAARWTFLPPGAAEAVVHESSQALPAGADVVTEFHIAKPDGFPAGNYKVAVTLDGQPVASQTFAVHAAP
jgi:hypothetical protein